MAVDRWCRTRCPPTRPRQRHPAGGLPGLLRARRSTRPATPGTSSRAGGRRTARAPRRTDGLRDGHVVRLKWATSPSAQAAPCVQAATVASMPVRAAWPSNSGGWAWRTRRRQVPVGVGHHRAAQPRHGERLGRRGDRHHPLGRPGDRQHAARTATTSPGTRGRRGSRRTPRRSRRRGPAPRSVQVPAVSGNPSRRVVGMAPQQHPGVGLAPHQVLPGRRGRDASPGSGS